MMSKDESSFKTRQSSKIACTYCNRMNKIKNDSKNHNCKHCLLPINSSPHKKWQVLDPDSYIHPLDNQALNALQKIPGIQTILKKFLEMTHESYSKVFFNANSVKVTENQYADLNAKLDIVCHTLSVPKPDLYVTVASPFGGLGFNAFTGGVEKPFIVIYASMLERLNDMEILSVLAHEVGHIHCQHVLYKVAADILIGFSSFALAKTGLGSILGMLGLPIQLALITWSQKSELSCDRAALLVTQDERVVMNTLMKMAGGTDSSKVSLDEFILQAKEFDSSYEDNFLDKVWTLMIASGMSHPFPVWRVSEILKWVEDESSGYHSLLN